MITSAKHLVFHGTFVLLFGLLLGASSYFFCVSMPLAAITGHRGLTRGKTMPENVVLFANIAGAWLSLVATLALVYAAAVSL